MCGIKELCDESPISDQQEKTLKRAYKGNFVFAYSSSQLLQNQRSPSFIDSILSLTLGKDSIKIIGFSWGKEAEELGYQRAKEIENSLRVKGLTTATKLESRVISRADTTSVFRAFQLEFIESASSIAEPNGFGVKALDNGILVYFPVASADPSLSFALKEKLESWVGDLEGYKGKVLVTGHTDNTGTSEANQYYGMQRALSIANLLTSMGVPREQLVISSEGELNPVESNDTEAGRKANRRVEIKKQP